MVKSEHVKDFVAHFHRSKDSNWEAWREELDGNSETEAARDFVYMGYEIGLATKVDMETGKCVAYGIYDGKKLINFEKEVQL